MVILDLMLRSGAVRRVTLRDGEVITEDSEVRDILDTLRPDGFSPSQPDVDWSFMQIIQQYLPVRLVKRSMPISFPDRVY